MLREIMPPLFPETIFHLIPNLCNCELLLKRDGYIQFYVLLQLAPLFISVQVII